MNNAVTSLSLRWTQVFRRRAPIGRRHGAQDRAAGAFEVSVAKGTFAVQDIFRVPAGSL